MAKAAYTGINNIARNVSKIYTGVNGTARKVTKGYVGVNGIARQFWGDSVPKDYDEVYPGPTVNPSYLKNCWQLPLYVHKGPFTVNVTASGQTDPVRINIPEDGYVINNSLYKPDYNKIQLFVFFKDQPSASPSDLPYFDANTYFVEENNITYYLWIMQPRNRFEYESAIKESVRTAYGVTDNSYSQWEAAYIIFNKA